LGKGKNSLGEGRYGVTHAFELKTAETLGAFGVQLQQHTEQIKGINDSFSAMNLAFAKMEIDIHDIRDALGKLQNPSISLKTLLKVGLAMVPASAVGMLVLDYLRALLHLI
jgi:hypothetical protein